MTPGLRAALNPNAPGILATRLKAFNAFRFITCDKVQGRTVERHGARIEVRSARGEATTFHLACLWTRRP